MQSPARGSLNARSTLPINYVPPTPPPPRRERRRRRGRRAAPLAVRARPGAAFPGGAPPAGVAGRVRDGGPAAVCVRDADHLNDAVQDAHGLVIDWILAVLDADHLEDEQRRLGNGHAEHGGNSVDQRDGLLLAVADDHPLPRREPVSDAHDQQDKQRDGELLAHGLVEHRQQSERVGHDLRVAVADDDAVDGRLPLGDAHHHEDRERHHQRDAYVVFVHWQQPELDGHDLGDQIADLIPHARLISLGDANHQQD